MGAPPRHACITMPVREDVPEHSNYVMLDTRVASALIPPISVATKDVEVQRMGLEKRLLQALPVPETPILMRLRDFVGEWLHRHLTPLSELPTTEEWLEQAPYPEHRKREILLAYQSLNGGKPSRRATHTVKSFIKHESYDVAKHARWINSRPDSVKAFVGPAFHAIEHEVFALPIFAKSFKAPGSLVEHIAGAPEGIVQATDFTAFESHMTPQIMDVLELQLYDYMLKRFPDMSRYIRGMLTGLNSLATRQGVRLKVKGKRMSGDMCTSLGNSFTNAMVSLFAARESGNDLDGVFAVFEGDDGLMVTARPVDQHLYTRLGFLCKVETHARASDASFCGKVFGPDRQVIRDPKRFFRNCYWSCLSTRSS